MAPTSTVQVVVAPPLGRVIRYKRDQVGNDLTAVLMWCDMHHEPVWVYGDGSFECPHAVTIGWSPDEHPIVAGPWETPQDFGATAAEAE